VARRPREPPFDGSVANDCNETRRVRFAPGLSLTCAVGGLLTVSLGDSRRRCGQISPAPALKVRSCLIDGEAMACDDNGLAVFELVRGGLPGHRDVHSR
jgi:hypothetical protein